MHIAQPYNSSMAKRSFEQKGASKKTVVNTFSFYGKLLMLWQLIAQEIKLVAKMFLESCHRIQISYM